MENKIYFIDIRALLIKPQHIASQCLIIVACLKLFYLIIFCRAFCACRATENGFRTITKKKRKNNKKIYAERTMAQWVDAYFFFSSSLLLFISFSCPKVLFSPPFIYSSFSKEIEEKKYKLAKGHTLVLLLLIIFHWKFFFVPVRCATFIAFSQKLNCFSFHPNKCHPFFFSLLVLLFSDEKQRFLYWWTKLWPKEISCQDVSTKMLNFLKPSENLLWYRYVCVCVSVDVKWIDGRERENVCVWECVYSSGRISMRSKSIINGF